MNQVLLREGCRVRGGWGVGESYELSYGGGIKSRGVEGRGFKSVRTL